MIIIKASDKRTLTLAPETEAEARAQEIWILLTTVMGECPLYRDFGISSEYMHMPVSMVETALTMAITDAFRKYLPEVELMDIRFEASGDPSRGILVPVLEVNDI